MIPFVGTAIGGKVQYDLPDNYQRWLVTLEGQRVVTETKKFKKKRSLEQNSYYWSVLIGILSREFGYETEEMHMVLREKFLRIHDDKHPDFVIAKSTTKLTTVEFVEYIEKIQRWAAEKHQIYLPDPNEEVTEDVS